MRVDSGKCEEVDLLVVGAGPAGSQAAMACARAGMNVVILDRKMEIGSPVMCADAVNITVLEDLGLMDDQRLVRKRIGTVAITGPFQRSIAQFKSSGSSMDAFNGVVERDRLDKELISKALLEGARLKLRAEYTGYSLKGEELEISYSQEGRSQRIRSRYLVLATGNIIGRNDQSMKTGKVYSASYSRSSGTAGTWPNRLSFGKHGNLTHRTYKEDDQVDIVKICQSVDGEACTPELADSARHPFISGTLQVIREENPDPGNGNVLRAGVAAGLYDPLFLTGFRESFLSGREAGNSIIDSLKSGNQPVSRYAKLIEKEVLGNQLMGKILRARFEAASEEKIENFIEYIADFDYNEISTRELFAVTGLKEEELRVLLPEQA